MKITIEVDLSTPDGKDLIDYLHSRSLVSGPAGLQLSQVGDENPNVTIHGPDGTATTVPADQVDAKFAGLQDQTLAEAMGRQPETVVPAETTTPVATVEATPAAPAVDVDAASKQCRDLIIAASELPGVQIPEVLTMLTDRGLPANTEALKAQADKIPAVIAALEGFITAKKASGGVDIP